MKKKKSVRIFIMKNSYLLVMEIAFTFLLSKLVVKGSKLISNSINIMQAGEKVNIIDLSLEMVIIVLAAMLISFLNSVCNELFSIKVQKECKDTVIKAVESAEYSFFENNTGAVINKLTSDINDMSKLLSEILPEILQYSIMIIIVGIAIIKMNWIIFAGIIIVFPTSLFISHKIAERINELAKKRRGKYDELSSIALDNVEGIEIAKAYGIESLLDERIETKANVILKNEYARNRYQALANGLTLLIKWLPTVICSLISLFLVLKNLITIGELMAFLVLLGKISNPLGELPFRIIEGKEIMISIKRIQELINTPAERSGSYLGENIEAGSIAIELKDVSFSYGKDKETDILKNINMTITKGEHIAIAGTSGAGKSTLMKLLCGFVRNTTGYYKLYGHDFEDWSIDAARQQMAYVSQDFYLFPGSVSENIAYGNKNIENTKVETACRKAGIYEVITALPEKFNTEVGERGVKLSGGEKQRLSIARALYKNAPIILLDEPTSALDEETQAYVNDMIYDDKEKTVIVIAHRLSTIKDVDRIYCMENGEIVETGTHEELMEQNGVYAALYCREVDK